MSGSFQLRDVFDDLVRRWRRHPRQGVQRKLQSVHLGSSYGGYAVCTDRLDAASIVYSAGIGEDISFDLALIERVGCTVHGFDPTPRSIAWVQALPAGFVLHPFGLADHDGLANDLPVRRLNTLMHELGHERIDLLKMAIEGGEYAVIEDLVANNIRPRQLLLEFHHQLPGIALGRSEDALDSLNRIGYRVFDMQPTGRELSLILG